MDFHINKDATLPTLVMEVVQDGRNSYKKFHEKIQNATITFSMSNIENGKRKINCSSGEVLLKETDDDCPDEEYYIAYDFKAKDTNKHGTFIGKFTITFLDGSGTLIVPIKEELRIHVNEGSIKK